MSELIRFEHRVSSDEIDESVAVDDDGTVIRTVSGGSTGASAVGWWRGTVDDDVVAEIQAKRGTEPGQSSPDALRSPAASGQWWALLDDRQRPVREDGQLGALLSLCAGAAAAPVNVVSGEAWTETWDDEPAPVVMLRLRADGDTPADIRIDDRPEAPVAAFVTDELETLGYLGSTFTVSPPVEATSVVRERTPADIGLILAGSLTLMGESAADMTMRVTLVVELGDAPDEPEELDEPAE
jgi:hypothetical protein